MDVLSTYEISRAENIRRNHEKLVALGIEHDVSALRSKPKPKTAPKPKPTALSDTGLVRRSSRQQGVAVETIEIEKTAWSAPQTPERDPFRCWWTCTSENPEGIVRPPLTELQLCALTTSLSETDRASLDLGDGEEGAWVGDMLKFARAYGGKQPEPYCVPSRENFKKVLDTVAVLASGDGVTCNYRNGTFDQGVMYTPKDDLDLALSRALKWLPKAKDKSNGWTFTHPFEKMKQYQRALFWRHLFPFVWPGAQPTEKAKLAAKAKAAASVGTDSEMWQRMGLAAEVEVTSPGSSAATAAVADDSEEDEPLSKRRHKMAAPVQVQYEEGSCVEALRGSQGVWLKARVTDINEDGTCDLFFYEEDTYAHQFEEGVALEFIRPLPLCSP